MFPWCLQQLLAGTLIRISSVDALPPEAARDRETWRHYGIKSIVAFPLSPGGGQLIGALGFNTAREERPWPDETVNRLHLVAQIFANALARKRADEALRKSEARLRLAATFAGVGFWAVEEGTGNVWATETLRELFGLAPDVGLTPESFYQIAHPEDRDRLREVAAHATQSGEEFQVEYRVLSPEQWLPLTGRTMAQELGNDWTESVHPGDVDRCLSVYTVSFDRREPFAMEYRLRRRDGEYRWLHDRGTPRISPAGEFLGYIGSCIDITERMQMEGQLQARLREIEDLKQQLEHENLYLREEVKHLSAYHEIVGRSDRMRDVLAQVDRVAATDSTVLITGETGTGKELIARAIHGVSKRKDRALVTINCASLPPVPHRE